MSRTKKELKLIHGGLSAPGKMPCAGYSLPAAECVTGSKLRQVEGSTCHGCYALKGRYTWPTVETAMYRRLESLEHPDWVPAMAESIEKTEDAYFRWHDSGDLQSIDHLRMIVAVCERTPDVKHWLPTREYRIVADYLKSGGRIPPNLNIRMSAHMIGGKLPTFAKPLTMSSVSRADDTYPDAHACPSRQQDNTCGDCRACWDPDVPHVDYAYH
jgi:hypothetical protein